MIETALARLMLLPPGIMGMVKRWSSGKLEMTSEGSPRVSGPNKNASPFSKLGSV